MAKKASSAHRDAAVIIVMGKNGTGKSTLAKKFIDAQGGRVLVVTMNGLPEIWRPFPVIDAADPKSYQDWTTGIRHVHYMVHDRDTMQYIHQYFHDGILVLDDCRGYIPSQLDADKGLKRLLIDFRHKMLDVYFIVHSPGQVPRQVWSFYSYAWIGATDALFDKRLPIDSCDRLLEAQHDVNKRYSAARDKNDGSQYGIFRLVKP